MSPSRDQVLRIVPPPDMEGADEALPSPDELFRRHARYIAGVAFHILGRRDEAEDVVQEVFLRATRFSAGVRDVANVRGWLTTIAVRVAGARLSTRRLRRLVALDSHSGADTLVAPGSSPEMQALATELYAILDKVPTKDRTAWCLRHLQERPLDEVAAVCGCSLATAKRRIAAVGARLRHIIEEGD